MEQKEETEESNAPSVRPVRLMTGSPKPKRRWLQFRLRTLVLFITTAAVVLGLVHLHPAHRQSRAAAALRACGGVVTAEAVGPRWFRALVGDEFFVSVVECDLTDPLISDADLVHLKGLTDLELVRLWDISITDVGMENLKGLTNLQTLIVSRVPITDAGVKNLSALISLYDLDLSETEVTDAGLENLKGMISIEGLSLEKTKVGDAGLEHLKDLKNLASLSLTGTRVSDVGLENLRGLDELKYLYLYDTDVSDAGVSSLQQALPKVKIFR